MAAPPPPAHHNPGSGIGVKFKQAIAGVQSSVSQYMSAPPDAEGGQSGSSSFQNVKRRMTETVKTSMGKAEPTADEEYEHQKNNIGICEKQLQELRKNLVLYLEATRTICFSSSQVGANMREIYTGSEPRAVSAADSLAASFASLDGAIRPTMDGMFLREVIEPIDARLGAIAQLKPKMKDRELLKLDFDARYRKLNELKSTGAKDTASDPTLLPRKEEELKKNASQLADMTDGLFREFDGLESSCLSTIASSLDRFVACQQSFFRSGMGTVTTAPVLPSASMPKKVQCGPPLWRQVLTGAIPMGAPVATTTTTTTQTTLPPGGAPVATSGVAPYPNLPQVPGAAPSVPARTEAAVPAGVPVLGFAGATSTASIRPPVAGIAPLPVAGGAPVPVAAPVPLAAPVASAPKPVGAPSVAPMAQAPSGIKSDMGKSARVSFGYSASKPDELSLVPGDIVTVLERHPDGWLLVRDSKGNQGVFPENHTTDISKLV